MERKFSTCSMEYKLIFLVPLFPPALPCIKVKIIFLGICWLNRCFLCCILFTTFWCYSIFLSASLMFQYPPSKSCSNPSSANVPFLVFFLGCCGGFIPFKNSCFCLLFFYGLGLILVCHLEVYGEEQYCPISKYPGFNDITNTISYSHIKQ